MRVRDPSEHKLAPARTAVRHGSLCLPQELPSHEASVDRSKCTRLLELLPGAPKPCPLPPPPAGMPLSSCMRYSAAILSHLRPPDAGSGCAELPIFHTISSESVRGAPSAGATPAMMLAPHRASSVLSTLRPYTEVLCCVRVGRRLGLARTDPYLSCAEAIGEGLPLARAQLSSTLRAALAQLPLGAVALALPLRRTGGPGRPRLATARRRRLVRAITDAAPALRRLRPLAIDQRLDLVTAAQQQRSNVQWQATGPITQPQHAYRSVWGRRARPTASVHAAVALQNLLDEHMGGWPNSASLPAPCHPHPATRSLPPTRSRPPAPCHPLPATRTLPPAPCHPLPASRLPCRHTAQTFTRLGYGWGPSRRAHSCLGCSLPCVRACAPGRDRCDVYVS